MAYTRVSPGVYQGGRGRIFTPPGGRMPQQRQPMPPPQRQMAPPVEPPPEPSYSTQPVGAPQPIAGMPPPTGGGEPYETQPVGPPTPMPMPQREPPPPMGPQARAMRPGAMGAMRQDPGMQRAMLRGAYQKMRMPPNRGGY